MIGEFDEFDMLVDQLRKENPDSEVLKEVGWECALSQGIFRVTLTSEDTKSLGEGVYTLHFRLIDSAGLSYRKLAGKLLVHQVADGI